MHMMGACLALGRMRCTGCTDSISLWIAAPGYLCLVVLSGLGVIPTAVSRLPAELLNWEVTERKQEPGSLPPMSFLLSFLILDVHES